MSPTPSSRRFHGANIASMACSALQLISTQRATVVLVLHRCGDAVVLDVHEGPLDLLVRRGGLELGHEVAVARGAGLVGLGVDRGLRGNQSASGLLSSGVIESTRTRASASAGSCGGASPPPIASFAAPMRPSMIDEYTCAAQFHVSMHWPTCNHHCGARRFRTRRDKGSSITVGDVQLTWTRGATSLGLAS